jgi:hypothetical protein
VVGVSLVREGKLAPGRVPSFLIECLTYAVGDGYFLVETDDRYDRANRILQRMWAQANKSRRYFCWSRSSTAWILAGSMASYPQEILAATVHAARSVLGGLKGGLKPPMASPPELATAIRSADYLAHASWPDPR